MSTGARTNVGVSYPTKLRATLRAPPTKWAIGAFFPESPCRMLSLVLSFASKESTTPLGAAAPPFAPESARQSLGKKKVLHLRAHQRTFRSPIGNLRASKVGEKPIRRQIPIRAGVGAASPGKGTRLRAHRGKVARRPFSPPAPVIPRSFHSAFSTPASPCPAR